MKTKINSLVISGFMLASLAFTTSCEKDNQENAQYANVLDVAADGTSIVLSTNMQSAFMETPDLTDNELLSLVKMKEEEKLARDVYSVLYEKWGSTVFSKISMAENNHFNAIIRLIQNYGSVDTLSGEAGIFVNAEFQALYNTLVTKGTESIEEAYKTGALIEEMDIKDLEEIIATTSNTNITMVFENLERGSRNHLRSFYNQLTALGIVYLPTHISQAEYDQIVTSAMEKGKQYKMQGKGNGKGKGNGSCNNNGQGMRKGKN